MAKRAARGRDTRMDDWQPEEKPIPIETVKCHLHEKVRTVEVVTGNTRTSTLSCGHIHEYDGDWQRNAHATQYGGNFALLT